MWALVLLGGPFRPQKSDTERPPQPFVGYPAPSLAARDLAGNAVSLADHRGKAVFLNFWASWCGPCRSEMPEIQRLAVSLPPNSAILTVNMTAQETSPAAVKEYLESEGFAFAVVTDPEGTAGQAYRVLSLPTSVFVSPEGVITARINGPLTAAVMGDYLKAAGR